MLFPYGLRFSVNTLLRLCFKKEKPPCLPMRLVTGAVLTGLPCTSLFGRRDCVSWHGSRVDECPLCEHPGESWGCRSELCPRARDSGPTAGGVRRGRPGRDIVSGMMAGQRAARASGSYEEGRRAGGRVAPDPSRAGSAVCDPSVPRLPKALSRELCPSFLRNAVSLSFPSAAASPACKADSALCCAQRQLHWDPDPQAVPTRPGRTNDPSRRPRVGWGGKLIRGPS